MLKDFKKEKEPSKLEAQKKAIIDFILENNPDLLKKTSLRFIAFMIGITATQLSRIKKSLTN